MLLAVGGATGIGPGASTHLGRSARGAPGCFWWFWVRLLKGELETLRPLKVSILGDIDIHDIHII